MAKDRRHSAYARFQRSTLGPAWRRHLVAQLSGQPTRLRQLGDPVVQRLWEYLQASEQDEGRSANADPELAAVEQLRLEASLTMRLRLATLGQLSHEAVSARTGVSPAVVALWQAVDFDIAGLEQATGWLVAQVIDQQPCATIAEQMRLVIAVGPAGAEAVLDAFDGLPVDEAARLLQQRVALDLKVRAALDLACDTPARAQRFAERVIAWQQAEAKLNLRRDELALEVTKVTQQHEAKMNELQLAHAAEQAKAAEQALANTLAQIRLEELRQRTHAMSAAARSRASEAAAAVLPRATGRAAGASTQPRPQQGAA